MSQMLLNLRARVERFEKSIRELVGGNSREIEAHAKRLAVLENPGEPVVPLDIKPAKIPERPALMEAAGVGQDPR